MRQILVFYQQSFFSNLTHYASYEQTEVVSLMNHLLWIKGCLSAYLTYLPNVKDLGSSYTDSAVTPGDHLWLSCPLWLSVEVVSGPLSFIKELILRTMGWRRKCYSKKLTEVRTDNRGEGRKHCKEDRHISWYLRMGTDVTWMCFHGHEPNTTQLEKQAAILGNV